MSCVTRGICFSASPHTNTSVADKTPVILYLTMTTFWLLICLSVISKAKADWGNKWYCVMPCHNITHAEKLSVLKPPPLTWPMTWQLKQQPRKVQKPLFMTSSSIFIQSRYIWKWTCHFTLVFLPWWRLQKPLSLIYAVLGRIYVVILQFNHEILNLNFPTCMTQNCLSKS